MNSKPKMKITVTVDVDYDQLFVAADTVVEELYDNFSQEVFDMLGIVDYDDLCKEVIGLPEFRKMIESAVVDHGRDALNRPYDYLDFDWVHDSLEWNQLVQACDQLQTVWEEIFEAEHGGNDCERAIKTLKAAGFRIVRA